MTVLIRRAERFARRGDRGIRETEEEQQREREKDTETEKQ